MTFRKYLVLAGVTIFSTLGDSLLSHGMKQVGNISLRHFSSLLFAVFNPWVAIGIFLLLAYFAAYISALSWADLTYVLPATSVGYILVAVIGNSAFHERVSPIRWLGILMITAGVGFVAAGPSLTVSHHHAPETPHEADAVSQEVRL